MLVLRLIPIAMCLLLAATLAGERITDPGSPVFLLSVLGIVCLSLLSILLYTRCKRRLARKNLCL